MGDFKGTVKMKDILTFTDFIFGPPSLIAGKELLLIDHDDTSCDCMWGCTGIIKVDKRDIARINFNTFINPATYIEDFHNEKTKSIVQEWILKKVNERRHMNQEFIRE